MRSATFDTIMAVVVVVGIAVGVSIGVMQDINSKPHPGEVWVSRPRTSNPFAPPETRVTNYVMEVRKGWVKYSHRPGTLYAEVSADETESMPVLNFQGLNERIAK